MRWSLAVSLLIGASACAVSEHRRDYPRAHFEVTGDRAEMFGVIDGTTPEVVRQLIAGHPDLRVIVMVDVPGSTDDAALVEAARLVRARGLETRVPSGGEIASGGTDFFLAGVVRTVAPGARVGVHSWGDDQAQGTDLPVAAPEHRLYLDYYEEMGVPAELYWFTLRAASAQRIHWLTPAELQKFSVVAE